MIDVRPFNSLGGANHGWLDAKHHFSFASYHDPKRMGWGALRVWNDDTIAAGTGFPPHPHADMEIITYVREGAITHRGQPRQRGPHRGGRRAGDERGHRHPPCRIQPGSRRPRGSSRSGSSRTEHGKAPSWGTKPFPQGERSGKFVALASGFDRDGDALPLRTDARVLGATLKAGETHRVHARRRSLTPIWCRPRARSRSTA